MERKSCLNLSSKTNNLLLLLILSVSCTLILSSLGQIHFAGGADEGYYLRCATHIAQKGISGFPDIFKVYFENPQHQITQNPLRVGYIILASIWLKLLGYSFLNLALLSLFFYCVFLIIAFYFAKKYFKERIALLFLILLAFSPLNLAMARRALIDSAVNLFNFLSIWLFWENLKERRSYKTILFILIYAFAILIKEGSVLLSVFFLLCILSRKAIFKKAIKWADFLFDMFFSFSIAAIVYIGLTGGVNQLFNAAISVLTSPKVNSYAIIFCSGPWFRYLLDFMLLSPWVCILAISFSVNYILKLDWQEETFYLLIFSIFSLFLYSFFIKNIRYLIFLNIPMCLFAVLMLDELVKRTFKHRGSIALLVLILGISLIDYSTFYYLFVKLAIYDPVSYWLLRAAHIIPWK